MHESGEDPEGVVDALITASRALVAVAARSVADLGDVTLPQYRALVVLAGRGPQRGVDLAAELGVTPSTATRLIDRLVKADLVDRQPLSGDRRAVEVTLKPAGKRYVAKVTRRRREEIRRIVARMSPQEQAGAVAGLRALANAAGEVPEQQWWLGFEQLERYEQDEEVEGEHRS
ncbi:MarR family winged helix-turn-helix transcriptional regulator [Actinopolymorpha cephalotaxi]|uniref:DNA-binding MarR family transcriptional regulator n=1 Tax=Actinopolymorpha cephalotaxi TaxID=504797 RepID=A0ABX2S679_9ACTN|nr:MarR family transcriptional regulator [Actinopolymorpha cephalotaxi]NYH85085.1 DNA-binding MarR family transcriptional regulator [Actinopolymorpha cephalotaxi]